MGVWYQAESFLTACISLVHEPHKPWLKQQPSCTNSRKELRRNCSPIGHNNTKHFLCPIRSRHPLEFLEIVRWESVPRGSFARTSKLSSRPFSRPDWLPLGLRGWLLFTIKLFFLLLLFVCSEVRLFSKFWNWIISIYFAFLFNVKVVYTADIDNRGVPGWLR